VTKLLEEDRQLLHTAAARAAEERDEAMRLACA